MRISGITATTIFGEERADRYINQLSAFFLFWSAHNIGTPRPELGEYILALPVEWHMLYFLQTDTEIIIIRILSQHQDAGRHLNWAVVGNHIALRENWQGYRGVPGQNSRSASSPSLLPSFFCSILFVLALPQFSQKP